MPVFPSEGLPLFLLPFDLLYGLPKEQPLLAMALAILLSTTARAFRVFRRSVHLHGHAAAISLS